MMKKIFIASFLATFLAGLMIVATVTFLWKTPYSGEKKLFTIHKGEGFSTINYRLYKENIIKYPRLFHYYTKFTNNVVNLKSGVYEIQPQMTMKDLVALFVDGKSLTISVTIPEGKNLYQIAGLIEQKKICSKKDFITESFSLELLSELSVPSPSVEGYLYPDTYHFIPNSECRDVIRSMVQLFHKKTNSINFSHPFLNKKEIIILASIVEKETGAGYERPIIAGVFINRLKKRMRLQSDPSTIYGIWKRFDGNLRKKDLLEKTAYNTYRINGLPLGPISNPGIDSIKAVLQPKKHDFFFFVSQNDGTHIFTKNYRDHLKAVKTYQLNYKNRAGKSWRDLPEEYRKRNQE